MKIFITLSIMATFSSMLHAVDVSGLEDPKIKAAEELIKKAKVLNPKIEEEINYQLIREEEIKRGRPCPTCPSYLALTDAVNSVVEKMMKDPSLAISDELPVKINSLNFLYFTEALRLKDGSINCKRWNDVTPDLRPTKFDGQFKLVAQDVLPFKSVLSLQLMNPDAEEVVYYYRGTGSENNMIIQAILTKKEAKFRYFRYTPTESENNPYNLPELAAVPFSKDYVVEDTSKYFKPDEDPKAVNALPIDDKNSMIFKTRVEMRNQYVPENIHFVESKLEKDIISDFKIKGKSDTTIQGNKANIALKSGKDDIVLVELNTRLSGKTDHKVTIPFSIRVMDDGANVSGAIEQTNTSEVLNLSLTNNGVVFLRSLYTRNTETNATSYVLARDIPIRTGEVFTAEVGKGESTKNYVSLRHTKTIKDNITMALDVRLDEDKKATLVYQLNAKF